MKFLSEMMTQEPQAIEVEVVEIDGATPLARPEVRAESPHRAAGKHWQNWRGRVHKLDARWWPLWVVLGMVAVVLMLTVGVFLGIVFFIFRALQGFLRAIFR